MPNMNNLPQAKRLRIDPANIIDDNDSETIMTMSQNTEENSKRSRFYQIELDELVDIIENNPRFSRKIIYTNSKPVQNIDIYNEIVVLMREKDSP